MLVTFRETSYKTVEVPDNTTVEELNAMVINGDVIVYDTNGTADSYSEYDVSLDNCETWIDLSDYDY